MSELREAADIVWTHHRDGVVTAYAHGLEIVRREDCVGWIVNLNGEERGGARTIKLAKAVAKGLLLAAGKEPHE